jgi:serine/threonine protein kinase
VWVAHDQELNREVAIKEIKPRQADHPDARAQFLLEGEITGGLEHPGIVPVYGMGRYPDGRPYYAMRFIRGNSLRDAIEVYHRQHPERLFGAEQSSVELRKLLGRFIDVCHAVSYAHSRRVLHRDLKPDNVMLGKFGETLVVDWGLAQAESETQTVEDSHNEPPLRPLSGSIHTKAGSLIGSVQYMSPEQAQGQLELLNSTSDIYSLGATLYNLLAGKPSIDAPNLTEALRKVQSGDIPPPRQIKPDIPRALEAICLKAMASQQKDRYATAQALAEEIECWLADEPVAAYPDSPWQTAQRWLRKHRSWAQAAAVSLLALTLISLVAMYVIDQARRSEMQAKRQAQIAREITEVAATFDIALRDSLTFDRDSLLSFKMSLDRLEALQAQGTDVKFTSLQERFERYLRGFLDSQHFDSATQQAFDSSVQDFSSVFADQSNEIMERWSALREDRISTWNTVLSVNKFTPDVFQQLTNQPADIGLDGVKLIRNPAAGQDLKVSLLAFPAGDIEWSVDFDDSWTARQLVGLSIQYGSADASESPLSPAAYEFMLAVEEFDHRDRTIGSFEKLPTIDNSNRSSALARVRMMILRGGELMRSRVIALPRGPLRMTCKRISDSLTFTVLPYGSVGQTLDCRDPFIVPVQNGHLGVLWPVGVRILGMTVNQKLVPISPSSAEAGDDFMAQGKYLDAIGAYRSISGSLEAKFKLALAYELTGDQVAYEKTIQEIIEASALGSADEAWILLAMVRQMAMHAHDARQLREDVRLLRASSQSLDLFALLPQIERDLVLQELMKIGLRFRLAFQTGEDAEFVETRNELLEVLLEDDPTRRNTLWRAADVYRMAGDFEKSELILRDLVDNSWRTSDNEKKSFALPLSPRDHRVLLTDLCWLLAADSERPSDALSLIERWLPATASSDQTYAPLLVERARVQLILREYELAANNVSAAQRWLEKARQDLELFVSLRAVVPDLTYMEWGEAQLLLGLITLEEGMAQGKDQREVEEAARKHWQQALRRSWSGGPLVISDLSQMVGAEGVLSTNELAIEGLAISLYREVSSDEVDRNIRNYVPGSGLSSALANRLVKALLSPKGGRFGKLTRDEFFNRLFVELYDSQAGNSMRRNMILRKIPLKDFQHDPIYYILYRAISLGGFDSDGFPPAVEPIVWEQLTRLVNLYNDGTLQDTDMEKILRVFTGNFSPRTWQELQSAFGPQLSTSAAYVFGGVYRQRGEHEIAEQFFTHATESAAALPEIKQVSMEELAKIRARP